MSLNFANLTTKEEVLKLFKPNADGVMEFRDYLNRGMSINKSVFIKHTTGKYLIEGRQNIFEEIPIVLQNPEEVWMKKHQGRIQLRFLKIYNGNTVVVESTIFNNKIFIESWYLLTKEEITKRVGILLK